MVVKPSKVVVVVPTYNERDTLPILIDLLADLKIANLRVLVVDDDSPDGTGDIADDLAVRRPELVGVLHRSHKDGLGRAYIAGMGRALHDGADIVVQMDADLSHPASAVPIMIDALQSTDAALVIGSRYVAGGSTDAGWPWWRKFLSRWANFYVNAILRLRIKDSTAGFKAWRAQTLVEIDLPSVHSSGYSFQVEMTYRAVKQGLTIREVPITFAERTFGVSKMSLSVQIESAITPWRLLLSRRPTRPSMAVTN